MQVATPVTLTNCADEPIHIPGSIQPHGALLAFDLAGALIAWSGNAPDLLAVAPALDMPLASLALPAGVHEAVAECLESVESGEAPATALEVVIGSLQFDCIVHVHCERLIIEFELRHTASDAVAAFALKAHTAIDRLKRQKSIDALLQMATEQVRTITGFDRVMAYRFHHDDSGDVTAEAHRDGLEPYLGRRYPAGDIPAQARRLYIINTLRLIADVAYSPSPLVGRAGDAPLDLSHSVLRSVSPIHVEYLQNMGVGASMSVSIVVAGRLWGLLACHHMSPLQVPYSVRMAADVMAQVIASLVQSIEARERARMVEQAAEVRTRVMETLLHNDEAVRALLEHAPALCQSLRVEALVVTQYGKVMVYGDVDAGLAAAMVASLPESGTDLVERTCVADWPEVMQAVLGQWAGLLALRFDPATSGWLLGLRREQIHTIRWAGRPEKEVRVGPLGSRLTPRGSFDEWREMVRGRAVPWDAVERLAATQLLGEMNRASVAKHVEMDRARAQLLAMLGHDLRGPLHAINMAATVMQHGGATTMGSRIQASSTRMERLISQVLDMSRINGGLGLGVALIEVDLVPLLRDLLDEVQTAHAGLRIDANLPPTLLVRADGDRMMQVMSNLVSNARHHGDAGEPIEVALIDLGGQVVLEVRNKAPAIPDELLPTLYSPLKHTSVGNVRNRGGLGLGLHIAQEIVQQHGGSIEYRYDAPHVVFAVALPRG
ncbi:Bacteriophytochrome (light-regulated signal transduction histidine kinase) [Duganella sp. CF517]|uniref:ATP-binding protein n=1 Tax=Duganella sp. CF517 TaxID=1881038 RepID=UPI0008B99C2F|nr:ATP-binding protein [Duganella sp. CF517]SEO06593.1 Bacteriophytochrome (light-regulated signal transduction histidine kinase) [Duganella sp. CF517]